MIVRGETGNSSSKVLGESRKHGAPENFSTRRAWRDGASSCHRKKKRENSDEDRPSRGGGSGCTLEEEPELRPQVGARGAGKGDLLIRKASRERPCKGQGT